MAKFFTIRVVGHWNRFPTEAVDALGNVQTRLDGVLCSLFIVEDVLAHNRELDLGRLKCLFQPELSYNEENK